MRKKYRVDMVTRCSVVVEVDEEKWENDEIDLGHEINHYLNQGNWAKSWDIEDPDYGIEEVDETPDLIIA